MIEINNLTKQYGRIKAVDDISFTVGRGEIVGFLGPNGAGKTTTMNIITGYIPSTAGVVKVAGHDVMEDPDTVKRLTGYLPENPPLYLDLTVMEYLDFVCDLKKVPRRQKMDQINDAMDLMGVADHRKRLLKNLSKGYRQRVGFAQALLGNPELLILDEPTVGLDPKQIIEIRKLIVSLGRRHTIILSSHIMQEVSAVCERVIIINKGKIAAVDTPENLAKGMGHSTRLSVTVHGPSGAVAPAISDVKGVMHVDKLNERGNNVATYLVESERDQDVREPLFFAMARIGFPIIDMRSMGMTLEEIFLELVSEDKAQEAGSGEAEGTGVGVGEDGGTGEAEYGGASGGAGDTEGIGAGVGADSEEQG